MIDEEEKSIKTENEKKESPKGEAKPAEKTVDNVLKNRKIGVKQRRFTPNGDEVLKAAIDDGEVNLKEIAAKLDRSQV